MLTLNVLCELFLSRCRAERLSTGTIAYYRKYLKYVQAVHGPEDVTTLTVHHLRAILAALQAEGRLAPTTINHLICAWRACLTWAFTEELLDANPTARLKKVKAPQRVPETMTRATLQALLDHAGSGFLGARDRTMMLVLLDTGIRISELMGLTVEDVDVARGLLTVIGKGDKQRRVPVSPPTCVQLVRYLGHRAKRGPKSSALWVSQHGGRALNLYYLDHRLAALCRVQGLPHVHAHMFRHTAATELLRNGANPQHVQLLLGHTSVSVTQRYIHLAGQDVEAMHQSASPVTAWKLR